MASRCQPVPHDPDAPHVGHSHASSGLLHACSREASQDQFGNQAASEALREQQRLGAAVRAAGEDCERAAVVGGDTYLKLRAISCRNILTSRVYWPK
jgi:hypothetical protein